jgi:hypothetical protein
MLMVFSFLSLSKFAFNSSISFSSRFEIILKHSFSASILALSLDPQQGRAAAPHPSMTPLKQGISNNTKGLDKSKEQNSVQTEAIKCFFDTF